jgi:hypothetical protein
MLATDVISLYRAFPYAFTAIGLSATGIVEGLEVRCVSREMQLHAHTGYDLPVHHVEDLRLLDEQV